MKPFRRRKTNKKEIQSQQDANIILQSPFSSNIDVNVYILEQLFKDIPDLVMRHFLLSTGSNALLIYMKGLVDKEQVHLHVLRPLMNSNTISHGNIESVISVGKILKLEKWQKAEELIFNGFSILFIDGVPLAYAIETKGWPQRAIEEPATESTIKGAHQGFIETGVSNVALVRRYIQNRELKIKEFDVGRRSRTKLSVLYIEDLVHPEVLQELEDRIQQIDIDAILNTGELEELIEDNPFALFPQSLTTERPDGTASHLLQGRIAIIVDGSPSALIAPMTFTSFFQTVDDYSMRWTVASFIRLLRFGAFFIAVLLPALYIASISFHYEIIPVSLLISVGESRAVVPFPPIIEALLMELALEMMREAGLRLPAPVGQTVGIVGGIVIGQAAVEAGIVSNIMVIVVSITAISSFIIPNQDMATHIRLLRFPFMLISTLFGMVGIVIGIMIVMAHFVSLESLGTPYGSPIAPLRLSDWKDNFIRFPRWAMVNRPISARTTQLKRQKSKRNRGDQK
ncbi:spore germination protein [Aeromicrobium ponti]|uniref:Spore germination protein n=1 Tax=Cytobacillus oceanisediminis TaxID=665099 RepID=A0A562K760_9BACI|nr:spore germination protein [Cytobacillus oceanisediminis]TWH91252.1 spore germination protein [Cytobacillus oceanisediminis]